MKTIIHPVLPLAGLTLMLGLASTALAEVDGQETYENARPGCGVCHNTGAGGAPKVGDAGTWGDRLDASIESLAATVLEGKGSMPAYQGRMSEEEAKAAVSWMVEETR